MIRKTIKILALAAVIICVLLLAVLTGIQVFSGTDTAGRMVRDRINSVIPGSVSWREQHVSVFGGHAEIQDFTILDHDEKTLITTRRLFADISLIDLFRGRIVIEKVEISKPETSLEIDRQGRLNLIGAFADQADNREPAPEKKVFPKGVNVRINEFILKEGRFSFKSQRAEHGKTGPVFWMKDIAFVASDVELADKAGKLNLIAGSGHVKTSEMDFPVNRISLMAALGEGRIEPLNLEIRSLDSRLSLSGAVANIFDAPRMDVNLEISAELSKLQQALGLGEQFSGKARLQATASGRPDNPDVSIKLDYGGGRLAGMKIEEAALEAGLKDRIVEFKRLEAALEGGRIKTSGMLDLQEVFAGGFLKPPADLNSVSFKFDVAAGNMPLSGIPGVENVSGILSGDLDVEGTGIYPDSADIRVNADMFAQAVSFVESIKPLDLKITASTGLAGGRFVLEKFIVDGGYFTLKSAGRYGLAENTLDMNASGVIPDLSGFAAGLGIPGVRGKKAEFSANVSGPVSKPLVNADIRAMGPGFRSVNAGSLGAEIEFSGRRLEDLQGKIAADLTEINTGFQPVSGVRLESRIDSRKLRLKTLEIYVTPEQAVRAGGWLSLDGDYDLRIASDSIALNTIKMFQHTKMDGDVKFSAQGAGSLRSPLMEAVLDVSDLAAGGEEFPDTEIKGRFQDSSLRINIEEPFFLQGEYNLAENKFSATAELPETQLAPFFRLAGLHDFTGKMTGRLEAEGNVARIRNTRAQISVSDLEVRYQGDEIASSRELDASLEDGEISIPGSRITVLKQGQIDIRGTGNLEREIDIAIQGSFPAKLAESMASREIHSTEGLVLLSGGIGGTVKHPDFSAKIELKDVGFTINRTMQQLRPVNGRIRVTRKQIKVLGISGMLGEGEFNLSGIVDLENFRPDRADMSFSAQSLPIKVPGLMDMKIDTDLKFTGTPESASLFGDVVLVEGRYFKDVNLSLIEKAGDIGRRRRQAEQVAGSEMPVPDLPFLKELSLDISFGHRNPFMVDNNMALLSVRPQLSIGGTVENPVITGRAEISEGTIAYRNTEFEVKKGVVDFINPYRIEPAVEIVAESQVRKWTITLSVTGTPQNLDFSLSSNPAEEDADIISLLAVGKTTRELTDSSAAGRSPEEMLADLLAGRLEKQVKAGTGLDIVELEYEQNGTEGEVSNEVRVTLGKELSRRLSVKYGVVAKRGEMVQQSTAVYKLMENLSATAYQDTEGAFGGEMRYRLEFR